MSKKTQVEAEPDDNVIPVFFTPKSRGVPPLTDEEIVTMRTFLKEFAIIRATCPMVVRALSQR